MRINSADGQSVGVFDFSFHFHCFIVYFHWFYWTGVEVNMTVVENMLKALWVELHIIVLFSGNICRRELTWKCRPAYYWPNKKVVMISFCIFLDHKGVSFLLNTLKGQQQQKLFSQSRFCHIQQVWINKLLCLCLRSKLLNVVVFLVLYGAIYLIFCNYLINLCFHTIHAPFETIKCVLSKFQNTRIQYVETMTNIAEYLCHKCSALFIIQIMNRYLCPWLLLLPKKKTLWRFCPLKRKRCFSAPRGSWQLCRRAHLKLADKTVCV